MISDKRFKYVTIIYFDELYEQNIVAKLNEKVCHNYRRNLVVVPAVYQYRFSVLASTVQSYIEVLYLNFEMQVHSL
jgi:hypothetical protein